MLESRRQSIHVIWETYFCWKTIGKWDWKVASFYQSFIENEVATIQKIKYFSKVWTGTIFLFCICKASSSMKSCSTHRSPSCSGDVWRPLPATLSSTSVVLLWRVQATGLLLFESNCVFNRLTSENPDCYEKLSRFFRDWWMAAKIFGIHESFKFLFDVFLADDRQ